MEKINRALKDNILISHYFNDMQLILEEFVKFVENEDIENIENRIYPKVKKILEMIKTDFKD